MEDTWSQQTAASSVSTNDLHNIGATSSHLQQSQSHQEVTVKRRVSRVESLRNLFFSSKGGHPVDARRRFLLKKRTRSEEKEKVSFLRRPQNFNKISLFRELGDFVKLKKKLFNIFHLGVATVATATPISV